MAHKLSDEERQEAWRGFRDKVNLTPTELERWLEEPESKSSGQSEEGGESTGHRSGRRIAEIQRMRKDDLGEDDYAHMRKVVGYIDRHLAQRPAGDVRETTWRYSLMNWGHDPLKN
ncbi:DUF3140 domain-containing protein [Streptomyces sp. DSM 42041]|uniref:DUF3140 domain-containing protein n=1 Tax=Streptomyces hazeniae TaxID=3075538 RepID=A0ABU2NYW3_9ACTN|nr:DUF3140 domain-containing protein [Streptomyces sp. DSM 42041]MDT0382181.1 DUF3140 domain-containing protein [Streptomyces sp. DSM 42041]